MTDRKNILIFSILSHIPYHIKIYNKRIYALGKINERYCQPDLLAFFESSVWSARFRLVTWVNCWRLLISAFIKQLLNNECLGRNTDFTEKGIMTRTSGQNDMNKTFLPSRLKVCKNSFGKYPTDNLPSSIAQTIFP